MDICTRPHQIHTHGSWLFPTSQLSRQVTALHGEWWLVPRGKTLEKMAMAGLSSWEMW